MSRIHLLLPLLLLSGAAFADDRECAHSAPRDLALDLAGVKTVAFEIAHHKLRVDASANASGSLDGRACASSASQLDQLVLTQERQGDKLVVRAQREGGRGLSLGRNYAYMSLATNIPDDVLVQLIVGSGDATVTGAQALSIDLGSGDVDARGVQGATTVKVGSGDVELAGIGSLHVLSIGSGDVEVLDARGDVRVDSVGSGDFSLKRGQGSVEIGAVGSGDVELEQIDGSVVVGSIGSGDLEVSGVGGSLAVRSKGSGDVRHSGVAGAVEIPTRR